MGTPTWHWSWHLHRSIAGLSGGFYRILLAIAHKDKRYINISIAFVMWVTAHIYQQCTFSASCWIDQTWVNSFIYCIAHIQTKSLSEKKEAVVHGR